MSPIDTDQAVRAMRLLRYAADDGSVAQRADRDALGAAVADHLVALPSAAMSRVFALMPLEARTQALRTLREQLASDRAKRQAKAEALQRFGTQVGRWFVLGGEMALQGFGLGAIAAALRAVVGALESGDPERVQDAAKAVRSLLAELT